MQEKRITIRIPFEIWKSLRELQTEGKIDSIQQAAVIGMNNLVGLLKHENRENGHRQMSAAKKRVLKIMTKEKPLGNWEDLHRERTNADAGRS